MRECGMRRWTTRASLVRAWRAMRAAEKRRRLSGGYVGEERGVLCAAGRMCRLPVSLGERVRESVVWCVVVCVCVCVCLATYQRQEERLTDEGTRRDVHAPFDGQVKSVESAG